MKRTIQLLLPSVLIFVLVSCSTSITEEQATERAKAFFTALQTDDLAMVYDTYGSKQWKENVSFDAFEQDVQEAKNDPFETFAVNHVQQATDDQMIVDGQLSFPTYTSEVRLILSSKEEIMSLEFHSTVARLDFPEQIIEENVTIGEGTAFPLEGKITVPKDAATSVPAVILVHGSGPADEDESAYAYKPFRDIAWGLAERGIASIRYDKRTFVYGNDAFTEGIEKMNVQEETIDDAVHAVNVLLADERVDSEQMYVLGHSLGGMQAPRIAATSSDVAGIISLAGSPRSLAAIILDQQQIYLDDQTLPEGIHKQQEEELEQMGTLVEDVLGMSEEAVLSEQLFGLPAYYFWEMEQHPVEEIVDSLDIPMYILQGDADFQVFKDIDYVAWQNVLEDKPDVTFSSYPNLNHFFIEVDEDAGSWTDSYEQPGIVSEQVIDDLARWVHEQATN